MFSYKFSNLIGTVYRKGNIIFSHDGNSVLCPVGNKISIYDLQNNRSHTLPVESRFNYTTLALSPNGLLLIAAEEEGEMHIINLNFGQIIYRKRLNSPIKSIHFSPDGKHFAVTKLNTVSMYVAPGADKRVFNPFVLEKVFQAGGGDSTCFDWSFDSRVLAVGSEDMGTRIYGVGKFKNLQMYTIGSCRDTVMGAFFEDKSFDLFIVGRDGSLSSWECTVDPEGLIPATKTKEVKRESKGKEEEEEDDIPLTQEEIAKEEKEVKPKDGPQQMLSYKRGIRVFLNTHFENKRVFVTATEYHKKTHIMVVAFASGDFILLDMNDGAALIHSLNISEHLVTSVALNQTGDWIALGVSTLGQLLVWEWQSETYILKQQGHFNNMRVAVYSPDGLSIATGGEDGKVKLWSTLSSFSFVTFKDHTAPVTGLAFTQSGKAILSSSLDGTVRAFDLTRYRNFKTLTSPQPTQFSCLSVDCAGELVVAGGQDRHDIYLWSLKTGKLLEVLSGHTGPVVSVEFSKEPGSTMLVSTGWDNTVKVWDAISNTTAKESILLLSDGICVTFRPDGKQIAVATLDGQINMFEPLTGKQQGSISGKFDLGAGRADADKITAKKNRESKCFTTLCYSADGQYIIAGGQSKNVCIYCIEDEILVKKFEITQNRSFDAMDETINRRKLAENGINLSLVEEREDKESAAVSIRLPGTRQGDKSTRAFRPEVRVTSLSFSPTGRSWAATSTEGLLIYSLDENMLFDPLYLDVSITPAAVRKKLREKEYSTALLMALRLNMNVLKQEVVETIPMDSVELVCNDLATIYVEKLLKFVAEIMETTPHLGLYANWAATLIRRHAPALKIQATQIRSTLNSLQRSINTHAQNLSKVCNYNEYMLRYLRSQASLLDKQKTKTDDAGDAIMNDIPSEFKSEENIEDLFEDEVD